MMVLTGARIAERHASAMGCLISGQNVTPLRILDLHRGRLVLNPSNTYCEHI